MPSALSGGQTGASLAAALQRVMNGSRSIVDGIIGRTMKRKVVTLNRGLSKVYMQGRAEAVQACA